MAEIATAIDTAWRDYDVDGVPSSGRHKPLKSEIRSVGDVIEEIAAPRPENFNAACGDNVTDATSAWTSLINQANGSIIKGTKGATYYVPSLITTTRPLNIDLNGATVRCPNGFINASQITKYEAGAYFTTTAGKASFDIPVALVGLLSVGDIILTLSDTVTGTPGGYTYGNITKIIRIDAPSGPHPTGEAIIEVAFSDTYQVDKVWVVAPHRMSIRNGCLDLSGATQPVGSSAINAIGVTLFGDIVEVSDLVLIGSDAAGQGVNLQGMTCRATNIEARGFLNSIGLNGGGRIGYGAAAAGDRVILDNVFGERCKHAISVSNRTFKTRLVTMDNCVGMTPRGQQGAIATLVFDGSTQPLYQASLDCHANVQYLFMNNCVADGVNSLVACRNGHMAMNDCVLVSRGCTSTYGSQQLITSYEDPIRNITITNLKVIVEDGLGLTLPWIFGRQVLDDEDNGNVLINGLDITGTEVGLVQGGGSASFTVNTASVVIKNARGSPVNGVSFGSSTSPFGVLDDLQILDSALVFPTKSGINQGAVEAQYADQIKRFRTNSLLDGRALSSSLHLIRFGNGGGSHLSPELIDLSGAEIHANEGAVIVATSADAAPGTFIDDPSTLVFHNYAGVAFAPGLYGSLGAIPTVSAKVRGKYRNVSGTGASAQNLRFPNRSNLNLDGADLNTQVAWGADPPASPVGCRVDGALFSWRDSISIDPQGNLWRATIPAVAYLPVGQIVYNSAAASGLAGAWQYIAAGWVIAWTIP